MKNVLGRRVNATEGSIFRGMIMYAIPLILTTLIQTCFNAVDLIVVGNMADSIAVASVGATSAVTGLLVNAFVGLSGGAKIILARLFGAQKGDQIQKCVDTVVLSSFGFGLLVILIGIPVAPAFLRLTNCPEECFEGALLYIRIYLCGAPVILLYNFAASILTASGDSQRPMLAIICGGLTNVVLNILLCLILPQKVAAVAIATLMSQVIAAFIVMRRLCTMQGHGRINLKRMRFHGSSFKALMRQGIPFAINSVVFPVANVLIQSAINLYGASAVAGNTTAIQFETIAMAFTSAFAATCTVFMGQNIGAAKMERVKRSFRYCLTTVLSIGGLLGVCMFLLGRYLCLIFLPDDQQAVQFAMIRMMFVLLPYGVAGLNGVLASAIQSYGHATYSAASSIFSVCIFRIIWMKLIYPYFENYYVLMACYFVSWLVQLTFNIIGYSRFSRKFDKEKQII